MTAVPPNDTNTAAKLVIRLERVTDERDRSYEMRARYVKTIDRLGRELQAAEKALERIADPRADAEACRRAWKKRPDRPHEIAIDALAVLRSSQGETRET